MALSLVTGPSIEPITVTEARTQLRLGSTAGEPCPTVPTVALPGTPVAGSCDNGVWRVGFTHVTAAGETELGPLSDAVTVVDNTVNGKLSITNITLGGSTVTSRKCYAVAPGATAALYAATIANNTATTLTLNIAASALGAAAPTVNTTEDPLLVSLIQAVRERAELETGRAMNTQAWDLIMDRFPGGGYIEVPKPPLQSVTSITYTAMDSTATVWGSSNYLVQCPSGARARRGRIALPFSGVWPIALDQMGAVTVRFVCGYGAAASAVPEMLKAAMKMDLATLYTHREDLLAGTSVVSIPHSARAIYWSHRSHAVQRLGR